MFLLAIIFIALGLLLLLYSVVSIPGKLRPPASTGRRGGPAWIEPRREEESGVRAPAPATAPVVGVVGEEVPPPIREPQAPSRPLERLPSQSREQLIAHGVLFLDSGRSAHLHSGELVADSAKILSGLKRVGRCTLSFRDSRFSIRSGNVTHSFAPGELDQVVFLKQAVAFVPGERSAPVVVMLTESTEKIKGFIRDHSVVPV